MQIAFSIYIMFIRNVHLMYILSLNIIMILDINFDDAYSTCLTCITVLFKKHKYQKIILFENELKYE